MGCGNSTASSPVPTEGEKQLSEKKLSEKKLSEKKLSEKKLSAKKLSGKKLNQTSGDNSDDEYDENNEVDDDSELDSHLLSEVNLHETADKLIVAREKQEGEDAFLEEDDSLMTVEIEDQEGKKFMAVKPWIGSIFPPSTYTRPEDADEAPSKRLELEYVYGYRSRDCRSNLRWLDSNTVVYMVAAVGVVHSVDSNSQTFFRGHSDDIVSLDLHTPSGN